MCNANVHTLIVNGQNYSWMLQSSVLEQSISQAQVLAPSPVDMSMGHILTLIPISVIPFTAGQLYIKAPDEHVV